MILLPVAVLMCAYALVVFLWRGSQIARKQVLLRRRLRLRLHLIDGRVAPLLVVL